MDTRYTKIQASDQAVREAYQAVSKNLRNINLDYTIPFTGVDVYNSNTAAQAVAEYATRQSVETPSSSVLGAPGAENSSDLVNACGR
jgi:hypothetical protein